MSIKVVGEKAVYQINHEAVSDQGCRRLAETLKIRLMVRVDCTYRRTAAGISATLTAGSGQSKGPLKSPPISGTHYKYLCPTRQFTFIYKTSKMGTMDVR